MGKGGDAAPPVVGCSHRAGVARAPPGLRWVPAMGLSRADGSGSHSSSSSTQTPLHVKQPQGRIWSDGFLRCAVRRQTAAPSTMGNAELRGSAPADTQWWPTLHPVLRLLQDLRPRAPPASQLLQHSSAVPAHLFPAAAKAGAAQHLILTPREAQQERGGSQVSHRGHGCPRWCWSPKQAQ